MYSLQKIYRIYKKDFILYTIILVGLCFIIYKSYQHKYEEFRPSSEKISFISYGNAKYAQAKERIKKQAEAMGCFNGSIKMYGPEDLSEDFKIATDTVIDQDRGGGYWIWKPYIIVDALSRLNDGDFLLYADSGCSLQKSGLPRFNEYIDMISPESGHSVLVMRLKNCGVKEYTTTKIFEYFNESINGNIGNSNQFIATTILCRKSPESLALMNRWLNIATTNPKLFTDEFNEESKWTNLAFRDNRHDQTIFSMIITSEPYKNCCRPIDEEVEGPIDSNKPIHATRNKS